MAFQQLSSKGSASSPDDAPRPEPNPGVVGIGVCLYFFSSVFSGWGIGSLTSEVRSEHYELKQLKTLISAAHRLPIPRPGSPND